MLTRAGVETENIETRGAKIDKVGTPVTLGVPAGVLGVGVAARLLGLKVVVLSEPAETTLATLAGKNLTAARVATAP